MREMQRLVVLFVKLKEIKLKDGLVITSDESIIVSQNEFIQRLEETRLGRKYLILHVYINHLYVYPLIRAFKKVCIASDLPSGSNKKLKRLTANASQVAGCLSLLYFHAPKRSIAMIIAREI